MRGFKHSGFDWIGEIPISWRVGKVKHAFIRKNAKAMQEDPVILSLARSGVRVRDISTNEGQIAESYFNYNPVEPGDFLLNPMDLYSGANCSMSQVSGVISPAYINLRAKKGFVAEYYDFYFKTQYWAMALFAHGKGVSFDNRWTLNADTLFNYAIPIPPVEEQERIASYLTKKAAAIDSVINQTASSITEYKKMRQAVISQAVTKGIRGERPLKDSGIKWAQQIPVDWNSINPKAMFTQRKDKATQGERQLTASQQHGVIYQDEYMALTGAKIVTVEKDFDILKHVEAGDFVISMRSFQGGLEYSTNTGSISSAYVMLIPNLEMVEPRFFRWLFKSSVYINALQSTSNLVRDGQAMRYSNFAQVRLYTVPLDEQCEIADYLDQKCAEIDKLIAKKEQFLAEMENYKKSLIYEYVTGKKEVPACQ